jgi:hypothetical protein
LAPERRLHAIDEDLKQNPDRVQVMALFAADGRRIAGNLEHLPPDVRTDNTVQTVRVDRVDESGRENQAVRLIARRLPNGEVLVIGRNVDEVGEIARVLGGALALGLVPAVLLCFSVGWALSTRARRRIIEVNQRVQRIVAGDLRERLPHRRQGGRPSPIRLAPNSWPHRHLVSQRDATPVFRVENRKTIAAQ